jgi:hypothetical protein
MHFSAMPEVAKRFFVIPLRVFSLLRWKYSKNPARLNVGGRPPALAMICYTIVSIHQKRS